MNADGAISRYRIVRPVGKGGMGVVYEAEDTRLNRPVALKFLPPGSLDDDGKVRFLNEARAAAAARHPNICPVYDVDEADGKIFIAMALLDGETLSDRIRRGTLPVGEAVAIAAQIAAGLEAAHSQGIVHRDIKSGNIMLSPAGHVSIMDFGLALQPGTTRLTVAGRTVGTPAYMSPEQALNKSVDRRSDVWSLGVVLYEMVSGKLPFPGDHPTSVLHAIIYSPPAPLSGIPSTVQYVLDSALAKSPERRFQSAAEFMAALKMVEAPQLAATLTMPLGIAPPPKRNLVKRLIAAGILALLAGGGYVVYRHTAAPAAIKGLPEQKLVAVLPFEVIGTAEITRTVSDGLVEILSSALSDVERFHGKIISIPSSEIRRRKIASAEDALKQYGVNLVITGSAQPAGSNIEFTSNLVDTSTVRQLSSRHFIYDPTNPLASRDQAVDVVVHLLQVDLTPAERKVIDAGDTNAPAAYSAYLEGRGMLARFDVQGNVDKAIAAFRRAIQADPNYALAYAGLGAAYWRKTRETGDKESAALAVSNAERAVNQDGSLALAHAVLGEIYGGVGREEDAVRELRTAMRLAPTNPEAPRQLATVYTNLGRFAEAEALYKQAIALRPTDWYAHLLAGVFYYQRERYPEAESEMTKAQNLTPDNDLPVRNLGAFYVMEGKYPAAIRQYQRALKIKPNSAGWSALALAYYYQHRFREAVAAAETALDLDAGSYEYWGNLGAYYKWSPGQENKSEPALRKALELAENRLATMPKDYEIRADLAEYRARLGDAKGARTEIDAIPASVRKPLASRLALACELTGQRSKAIELVSTYLTSSSSLNQIENDPDLAGLWNDSRLQQAIRDRR